jgi:hypothetical protein
VVEGIAALKTGSDNAFDDSIGQLGDLASREAKRFDAVIRKPTRTAFIKRWQPTHVMDHAINLDGESRFRAEKIEDERTGGMLAPKFETAGPLAQPLPENDLGPSHRAAKLASFGDGLSWAAEHRAIPLHQLRWSPSPFRGGD